jgi:hypothetical protein
MKLHPVVLEHAAALIGRTPWDVSRDAALLASAEIAAYRAYHHAPIICGIDVYNVEAEAWGATVEHHGPLGTPVLAAPLFTDLSQLLELPALDVEKDGRFPILLAAARSIATELPGVPIRVPLAGPFSIAVGLFGFEPLLMEMLDNEEGVRDVIQSLAEHQSKLCAQLAALGFQATIYESGAAPPLVSPELFSAFVAPALGHIFRAGRDAGAPVACIIGGDMAPVVEAVLQYGPAAVICPAETDQAEFMRKTCAFPDVATRINLPASLVAAGDEAAVKREIVKLGALARMHPLATLGTGVLPYEAKPASVRDLCAFAETI